MSIQQRFGLELRCRRHAAGLSQEKLAAAAGLHATYLGLLERGRRAPSLVVLEQLAKALGVTLSELVAPLDAPPAEKSPE